MGQDWRVAHIHQCIANPLLLCTSALEFDHEAKKTTTKERLFISLVS